MFLKLALKLSVAAVAVAGAVALTAPAHGDKTVPSNSALLPPIGAEIPCDATTWINGKEVLTFNTSLEATLDNAKVVCKRFHTRVNLPLG